MRHTKPNMDIEKQLLIGLITSDNFVKKILPVFNYGYLDLETVKKMAKGALDYYETYGKAPGQHIQDIFNNMKKSLSEEEADWMERLLVELDSRAEKSGGFNEEYLLNNCVKYFEKQKMRKRAEKVLDLLDRDKQDQAKDIFELPSITTALKEEPTAMTIEDLKKEFSASIEWLWRRHIPKGTSCMVSGREELGKTTICLQICKEVLEENPEGSIVWLGTEGFMGDTLIKMDMLGLDKRFYVPKKADGTYQFDLVDKKDLAEIKLTLDKKIPKPILLVVVDSLRGSTTISEVDDRIKTPMKNLNAMATELFHSALIWIHHHNKQNVSLRNKDSGNTAIRAFVRVAFAILKKGEHTRLIKQSKSNLLGVKCPDLLSIEDGQGRIEICEIEEDTEGMQAKAEALLIDMFKDTNKIRARDAIQEADAMDISKNVLHKIKARLGIDSQKQGMVWIWMWSRKRR